MLCPCHLNSCTKKKNKLMLACAAWGKDRQGQQVHCHCDNLIVVVACLRWRRSQDECVLYMLHCLVFVEVHFNCHWQPFYIGSRANHSADDLSCDNLSTFMSKVLSASPQPTQVSQALLDLLLELKVDWISPRWSHHFNSLFRMV